MLLGQRLGYQLEHEVNDALRVCGRKNRADATQSAAKRRQLAASDNASGAGGSCGVITFPA